VGCRANQADSADLVGRLDPRVIEIAERFEEADVAIINTCCVTAEAERDCRKLARRALEASAGARVVLVGCAVTAVEEFGRGIDPRVELRGGEEAAPEALAAWMNDVAGSRGELSDRRLELGGRTRALLKIQTGCTHGCSYCIVPRARGPERSLRREEVIERAGRMAAGGAPEVVLTGVQLGAWGRDLGGGETLAGLVPEVAKAVLPGRVRLSSVEPWSVSRALIEAMASCAGICPHLHIPLQSGDDGVLRAMRRGYTADDYLRMADRVRRRLPDVALGTDVITGFPGEDEEAFAATMRVLGEIEPAYVHAFTYSPRLGTRAERMPSRPPREVARQRTREVRALGAAAAARYGSSQLGARRPVVVEEVDSSGAIGITDNFIRVTLVGEEATAGEIVVARLEAPLPGEDRMRARL
jgi:threonylcarbamoyladenosine tRNA methylthiotransferase MtaB